MLWGISVFTALVVSAFEVFTGPQNDMPVRLLWLGFVGGLFVFTLVAPVFLVPLWQLLMALSWVAKTLKNRRRAF